MLRYSHGGIVRFAGHALDLGDLQAASTDLAREASVFWRLTTQLQPGGEQYQGYKALRFCALCSSTGCFWFESDDFGFQSSQLGVHQARGERREGHGPGTGCFPRIWFET